MVGRYATPEADVTITHHLPPPEDDSTQDVSMSFVIPPQADASNLLDQNYDDFFSGPGFVTLSTPVLPRHLTDTRQFVRKVTGIIQIPAVVPGPIPGQTLPTNSTTELELPDDRTELQETHIQPHPSLLSPPTEPFMSPDPATAASMAGMTSIMDPGSSRPSDATPKSDLDANFRDGPKSYTALPMASIITTEASDIQPTIESISTSPPSRHSTNPQNAQISRQPPITAARNNYKGPARSRGNTNVKSNQATSKPRGGDGLDCETTTCVSCVQLCQPSGV
ncbi:hypothetical protein BDM02DRAFT_3106804 [Thelephora ganbajun]|uniref:Uncharacterized protein n=1 Tax=Thelephora ganbajun TaxID=370292 RepID=A0ACB6ZY81_THEGA|nr:hypothetical protein BDM02DRAFT_3106804 [Thelephora ganbajun]